MEKDYLVQINSQGQVELNTTQREEFTSVEEGLKVIKRRELKSELIRVGEAFGAGAIISFSEPWINIFQNNPSLRNLAITGIVASAALFGDILRRIDGEADDLRNQKWALRGRRWRQEYQEYTKRAASLDKK